MLPRLRQQPAEQIVLAASPHRVCKRVLCPSYLSGCLCAAAAYRAHFARTSPNSETAPAKRATEQSPLVDYCRPLPICHIGPGTLVSSAVLHSEPRQRVSKIPMSLEVREDRFRLCGAGLHNFSRLPLDGHHTTRLTTFDVLRCVGVGGLAIGCSGSPNLWKSRELFLISFPAPILSKSWDVLQRPLSVKPISCCSQFFKKVKMLEHYKPSKKRAKWLQRKIPPIEKKRDGHLFPNKLTANNISCR